MWCNLSLMEALSLKSDYLLRKCARETNWDLGSAPVYLSIKKENVQHSVSQVCWDIRVGVCDTLLLLLVFCILQLLQFKLQNGPFTAASTFYCEPLLLSFDRSCTPVFRSSVWNTRRLVIDVATQCLLLCPSASLTQHICWISSSQYSIL